MKVIKGGHRVAILVGRVAIKVPSPTARHGHAGFRSLWRSFLTALLANLDEAILWSKYRYAGECFCPVLWSDPLGFAVVMRRLRPATEEEVEDFLELKGHLLVSPDQHVGNFGVDDRGRVLMLDYAYASDA